MSRAIPYWAIFLTVLAGCGGGGGGGSSAPLPANNPPAENNQGIAFTRMVDAGLNQRSFGGVLTQFTDPERFSGGIAAADYDNDGDVDLYMVGGNTEPNHLYQDQGDGAYTEVAASVGLDLVHWGCGPAFGDIGPTGASRTSKAMTPRRCGATTVTAPSPTSASNPVSQPPWWRTTWTLRTRRISPTSMAMATATC
jgi:hypothetical protein